MDYDEHAAIDHTRLPGLSGATSARAGLMTRGHVAQLAELEASILRLQRRVEALERAATLPRVQATTGR